jgi:hypothetical protein
VGVEAAVLDCGTTELADVAAAGAGVPTDCRLPDSLLAGPQATSASDNAPAATIPTVLLQRVLTMANPLIREHATSCGGARKIPRFAHRGR